MSGMSSKTMVTPCSTAMYGASVRAHERDRMGEGIPVFAYHPTNRGRAGDSSALKLASGED